MTFAPKALVQVHRRSGGIPRLINLICDRALLAGFSLRTNRITPDMVVHAAESLDLDASATPHFSGLRARAPLLAGAAVVLLASTFAVSGTAYLYQRFASGTVQAAPQSGPNASNVQAASRREEISLLDRPLPPDAALTILVASYPTSSPTSNGEIQSLTGWLEASGFRVYYADIDLGPRGRWQQVLAGTYTDLDLARQDIARLKAAAPGIDAHVIGAATAAQASGAVSRDTDLAASRSGTEP